MRCATCGEDHDVLEPTFRRPDVIFAMTADEKQGRVFETDDVCALRGRDTPDRFFVRGVLPVRLLDGPGTTGWGIWAEVGEEEAATIYRHWSDPDQAALAPMAARLANRVPGYVDTRGLPLSLQLTGPTSRPSLSFTGDSIHPFVSECRAGVCVHRVMEWLTSHEAPHSGAAAAPPDQC
jgi:hypothetical protein